MQRMAEEVKVTAPTVRLVFEYFLLERFEGVIAAGSGNQINPRRADEHCRILPGY